MVVGAGSVVGSRAGCNVPVVPVERKGDKDGGVKSCGVHMRSEITFRGGVTIYRVQHCISALYRWKRRKYVRDIEKGQTQRRHLSTMTINKETSKAYSVSLSDTVAA